MSHDEAAGAAEPPEPAGPPGSGGAAGAAGGSHAALLRWRAETLADELVAAERPATRVLPGASGGGRRRRLRVCSLRPPGTRADRAGRPLAGRGRHGPELGALSAAASSHLLSVFEIRGPEDLAEQVRRYRLAVPRSPRADWWRTTEGRLAWAIPDYLAHAEDHAAVHLSVLGYFTTAGRAITAARELSAGSLHTVLAGRGPDRTR